ncbi:WD40 repeat-like protein [Fomitiporia mediterranea MF3/22]|uniref:WD40 repeat-like protein n=1 Tax=Fomitiporia mediterranea (strain MF3/22) TaxID=694068 RepID=UPI0004407657|nr:WD40 repeat-like protein [Fomitiporia mediterranea MF3/22]EJC98417.1 WD40 repeat-like protein [Fomitiporia mediterranea MF3/22]
MDAFSRPQCLPGTRTEIVQQIVEWTLSDSDQNVFWLYGAAGSGKSTVSTTIAEHFRGISRLGAHLFFERGQSDPSNVIRTLVYKLASFDSTVEDNVIAAIKRDNNIAEATAATQFENLLHSPLVSSRDAMQGPVVIVLDALDECGTEKSRQSLMQSFRKGLRLLPKNFRFLITSRRESDINQVFSSAENICSVGLDHTSGTCKDDVLHYLDYELRNVFAGKALRIPDDWRYRMDRLTEASESLFVWASTAVKLVDCDNPARALQDLVSHSSSLSGLDQLYESILLGSGIRFNSETSKERFSQVLGLILLSRIPLSEDTIDGLLGYSVDEPSRLILSRLQSVLVYTPAAPIYFFHTSFRDYLTSSSRCNDAWFIDLDIQKKLITKRCFDVMKRMLRFNICKIESSYIRNDQILDLSERIKEKIPSYMEYACLFWGQHLHEAQFSDALSSELLEFLHKRFLYWLEVMSLLKKANTASPALLLAMNWVSSYDAHILAFLRDARRIITVYFPCISQSTSHIYVSFLPLASLESKFIADNYLRPNLPIVQVEHIGMKQRSPLLKKIYVWGNIRALAFSPDNRRIAGHLGDASRIWDAESGQVISGPFEGEHFRTWHSAFSPNLERIVSIGSDTETGTQEIRIWEVESGKLVFNSLEGHADVILSVAFSPDGRHVVSGSADTTIVVRTIDSKEPVSVRFAGHTKAVCSVTFSHDGKRIVSGSDDKSIRLWDLQSGHLICEPLEGHTESVTSVTFSHDGTRVVSGSADSTVRIWDARSGQCIYGPFRGHTSGVQCIAFSPNGERVVSGSTDRTVRIWDVETGKVISGPYKGHDYDVKFVMFSPDGTRVVSGALGAIRIWDAEGEQANLDKFEGHENIITSVAFSPDGKLVVSGSFDGTVQVWDAESGCTVSGPFKGRSEQSENILSISFSPDGGRVVSGSINGTILVWDVGSGDIVSGPFEGNEDRVESVSFTADGTRVISGSLDGTIRVWDVHSGQINQDSPRISSIAFSPDGVQAVSGFGDGTIIVWGVESGEVITGPLKEHEYRVYSVAFSSDGTNVVSGDIAGTIIIWNAESGQVVRKLSDDHTAPVVSLAFSSDGTRIVSGSYDNTIRVWDVKSRQAIFAPFEGHTDWVRSVAFSPDGSRVVSGSDDGTIRIWNVKGAQAVSVFNSQY